MRTASAHALAAWAALVCSTACFAQLQSHPPGSGPNPFDGEVVKYPGDYTAQDYPVQTAMSVISLLGIDEQRNLASVYVVWSMAYDDQEAVQTLLSNSSTCEFYCASRVGLTLNSAGQPACCDHVTIPPALAINSRGYLTNTYAERWRVSAESDTRIRYYRALQGRFEYSFDRGAFPFDSHYVVIDVLTAFKPVLARDSNRTEGGSFSSMDGYALEGRAKLRAATDPTHFRPDINSLSLPAWQVKETWMEVLQLKRRFTQSTEVGLDEYISHNNHAEDHAAEPGFHPLPHGQWRGGQIATYAVRMYIKIQRRTTGFWVLTCILPVALVTIFGFGVQSLPRQSLKARAELLCTIFLSLVLLQTVLQQFLPPFFSLALPLMLTLVGYLYTLLLFMVIIVAHAMDDQWRRRQLKLQRRWASQVFSMWAERLEQGPGAQKALAQSAACHAIPFDITREQVMNPLQGSRSKQSEEGKRQAAASDASRELMWIVKHRGRWWFRVPPIRFCVEWWKFTGLEGSQEYCRLVANRFDQGARLVLLLTYVGAVLALCLTTSASSDSQADAPIFPH